MAVHEERISKNFGKFSDGGVQCVLAEVNAFLEGFWSVVFTLGYQVELTALFPYLLRTKCYKAITFWMHFLSWLFIKLPSQLKCLCFSEMGREI